jgi:toxin FitB
MSRLLDTCVLSEVIKTEPHPGLLRWLAELEKGVAKLAASRRKTRPGEWLRKDLLRRFDGRLLGLDLAVAQVWRARAGASKRRGQPLPVIDSLIAATAMAHQLRVVLRNVADFKRSGLDGVNPWEPA